MDFDNTDNNETSTATTTTAPPVVVVSSSSPQKQQQSHNPPSPAATAATSAAEANNTSTSSSSTTSSSPCKKVPASTPAAVILARNIQKLFSFPGNNNKNKEPEEHCSDLDVPALLHDVDLILESRTVEDGKLLLRGMVEDLLKEIDVLRYRLDTTTEKWKSVKEERDVVNNDYKDRLFSLMMALQNATNGDRKLTDKILKDRITDGEHVVTADEAMELAFCTLTEKIENLSMDESTLKQQIQKQMVEIQQLKMENVNKNNKIQALETQFKSINQKRHKVVQKLTAKASASANSSSPASSTASSRNNENAFVNKNNIYPTDGSPTNQHHRHQTFSNKPSNSAKKQSRLVKLVDTNDLSLELD